MKPYFEVVVYDDWSETKEEFNEAELANLNKWANLMEMNALFGCLSEATALFGLLSEKMKEKKFGLSQKPEAGEAGDPEQDSQSSQHQAFLR